MRIVSPTEKEMFLSEFPSSYLYVSDNRHFGISRAVETEKAFAEKKYERPGEIYSPYTICANFLSCGNVC